MNVRRTVEPANRDLHFEIGNVRPTTRMNLNVLFSRIGNNVYLFPSRNPHNFYYDSVLGSFGG